ncbi:gasdermin-A-like [Sceloporus undulatus]|uniref:gasdermin-A-like n=1 Tax=Sceloporus undulatus TaxID=8520 RepID=UPI001C4D6432|nr:gasdermin-A-like [Sceloporus undulatus]
MPFHKATKSLAKLLDPQEELFPVCSIIDQDHYQPLCLLHEKKKRHRLWKNSRFQKTEYRLTDVLLSGGHAAKLDNRDPVTIVDQVDGTLEGDIGGLNTSMEIKGITSVSRVRTAKVQKIKVPPTFLDAMTKEAKINMDHEFIKQSKECQKNLYVVTEAVVTVEETQFDESSKMEGSIFYEAYLKIRLKGSRNSRKAIIIPKSSILAFRAKKLLLREGSSGIAYYTEDKRGTFQPCPFRADAVFLKVSEDLQSEVKRECIQFSFLSENLRGTFLNSFVAVMRDRNLLQKLELQLEEALEGPGQCKLKTDKPELQGLVENLQEPSGAIITKLAEAVLYFLGALDELGEEQLMLLEESVGKNIVSKQLALVENILDNNQSNREKVESMHKISVETETAYTLFTPTVE